MQSVESENEKVQRGRQERKVTRERERDRQGWRESSCVAFLNGNQKMLLLRGELSVKK